jgi:hypothetical protein
LCWVASLSDAGGVRGLAPMLVVLPRSPSRRPFSCPHRRIPVPTNPRHCTTCPSLIKIRARVERPSHCSGGSYLIKSTTWLLAVPRAPPRIKIRARVERPSHCSGGSYLIKTTTWLLAVPRAPPRIKSRRRTKSRPHCSGGSDSPIKTTTWLLLGCWRHRGHHLDELFEV